MATALVPGPITYLVGNFVWINVLLVNAVAVLSEDRFLARIGLSPASHDPSFGAGPDTSVKGKIINLISSIRTIMRMPLIFVNFVLILYLLILG
ncbi:hypothetical protein V2G26_000753 [Clonostachys chloroleuca]|uniref:Yos1-like protein n=6 Tax=Clonostachys TaxID=110564 RepID=A0ABY6U9S6_BIOOC|nr:unnamed protein product [Clonostachys rosea f. rosea IK726]CAH0001091.1 unnamed protein product [Clonostachys byssicola]CAH0019464.1 unnamed protein product [Clonostachys rhizophaga]CAH0048027.1 unnamed protein product [Clonostachys solani]CAI6098183.1 unnamed protein product [Clonostachys chloroleuca]VUC27831.1 unnamed protein product [Clonostachys rosea]